MNQDHQAWPGPQALPPPPGPLALVASFSATATPAPAPVVEFLQSQPDRTEQPPPLLMQNVADAVAQFSQSVLELGRMTFEDGLTAFAYAGGTATITEGAPTNKLGSGSNPLLGRYNVTPVVPLAGNGGPGKGRWLEAKDPFTYSFSAPITAIGFFGIDFGDFLGEFRIELRMAAALLFSRVLAPTIGGNGNLLFWGIVLAQPFDSARFVTIQVDDLNPDVNGFDELVVGNRYVPAPADPPTGPAPLTVDFVNLSLGATGWAWDFTDDGSIDSMLQNPSHVYAAPGTYSVRLRVSGPTGIASVTRAGSVVVT